jgi:hypothetical protein
MVDPKSPKCQARPQWWSSRTRLDNLRRFGYASSALLCGEFRPEIFFLAITT